MQTRSLGRTDLFLTEITLGTWGLAEESYGPVGPERFDEVVRAAIESGIRSFDLAPLWGDGEAERRVGRLVREASVEAAFITRGGCRRLEGAPYQSFKAKDLVEECEGSLERLGKEQIELWLLHDPGEEALRREEWREAIDRLSHDGKIRTWGVAVGSPDEARIAMTAGAQAICMTYNLLVANKLESLAPDLAQAGCAVLARSPLAYGLLAGTWAEGRLFDTSDHRARRWSRLAFVDRVRQMTALRFLVGKQHPDLATAALRFVLTHPAVTTAIVGARTAAQVSHAALAASGPPYLSGADMARLTKVQKEMGLG